MNWFDKFFHEFRSPFICSVEGAVDGGGASGGATSPPSGGTPASGATPPEQAGAGSSSSGTIPDAGDGPSTSDFESAFAGLDSDLDSIEFGEEPSTGTDPGAATDPEKVEPVAPTPPVAATTTPAVVPPQQTPPMHQVQPQAPSAPRSKREELDSAINDFNTGFDELSKWASTELFALSQEERDALETDAVSVIPNLMAKAYTRGLLATTNLIKNFVPEMIAQEHARLNGAAKRTSEAEAEFYKAWPDLNAKDHGEAMRQTAQVFRQLNPKATRQQAIDFVGRTLMVQFGITPKPTGRQAVSHQPFQPARPGGHTPTVAPPKDPYAGLDEDFDVE